MSALETASSALRARGQEQPLLAALLRDATRINFFRFCELIDLSAPQGALHAFALGTTDSPAAEPVRFRSRARLGFPGREIDGTERDEDHPDAPPTVRTTFLGLYGVDARMPSYFVDEIAQNRDGAEPLAAFLDLFHHRIITQYYRVWLKYRYPAGFRQDGSDAVTRYLTSFVGLGFSTRNASPPPVTPSAAANGPPRQHDTDIVLPPRMLLSMLGLAAQKTRTAEGLAGVLQHAAPDASITVEEFHPVWRTVTDFERAALGESCLLGRGFYDRANSVRVIFTPRTKESVLDLIPGHAAHREIMMLLRFYLGYESEAYLEMRVRPELMPAPILGPGQMSLGLTTQLLTPPARSAPPEPGRMTRIQLGRWQGSASFA